MLDIVVASFLGSAMLAAGETLGVAGVKGLATGSSSRRLFHISPPS
jgi:hypothetical protein